MTTAAGDADTLLEWTDDELAALAMEADPDAPLADDAVPFAPDGASAFPTLLPSWYMPAPSSQRRSRRRVAVVSLVIFSMLVLNAFGLCITNGYLEVP